MDGPPLYKSRTRIDVVTAHRYPRGMAHGWYREKLRTLYSPEQIQGRVRELGAEITRAYHGKSLVLLCVLKGSFLFAADLCRAIDLPLRIEFLGLQSYGDDTNSSGVVQITLDLTRPVENEHVLVVEDIVDTGLTLDYIMQSLKTRNPASVQVCALLHKPARMKKKVTINYLGFTIDDVFVVGYGLDWAQQFRNIPEIGIVTDPSG